MSLRIADAAPRQGWTWVTRGFALFTRHPLGYTLILLLYIVSALILLSLPLVGPLLLLGTLPLLTLGFMAASRDAQAGRPVRAAALFEPFLPTTSREARKALLRLCLGYAVLTALLMLFVDAVDGGAFDRLSRLVAQERTAEAQKQIDALLADPALQRGVWLRLLFSALISVPFWFAPALVAWQGQGLAQSLFSSTLACWRNKGAFLLYGLGWLAIVLIFGALMGVVLALLRMPSALAAAALPAALICTTAFYASLLPIYADCFATTATGDAPTP